MIVVPAAGEGSRFREAGYSQPKHMIHLGDHPMIDWVVDNVRHLDPEGDVFVVTQAEVGQTRGAIDTILRAADSIPLDEKLVLANCDQLLKFPVQTPPRGVDGVIYTFRSQNRAHSYVWSRDLAYYSGSSRIAGIVEKPETPPSWDAVSGVYLFERAGLFLDACQAVSDEYDGQEQYVSAAIKRLLDTGSILVAVPAPTAILGTPEDFQRFEVALEVAR